MTTWVRVRITDSHIFLNIEEARVHDDFGVTVSDAGNRFGVVSIRCAGHCKACSMTRVMRLAFEGLVQSGFFPFLEQTGTATGSFRLQH